MEYKRLTTDKPINSAEASLNFAVAKNGTTVLRAAGGEEDINLCEYLFEEAKKHGYNCVSSADDILQGDCLACDCIINVLYIVAVQAAELRERLKEFEDKIEKGELVEQKHGEWISVEDRLPETDHKNTFDYNVLVYIPQRKGCRQSGIYLGKVRKVEGDDGKGNFWGKKTEPCEWTVWGWSYFEHPVVTHWMPLPQPPKMKGAENG